MIALLSRREDPPPEELLIASPRKMHADHGRIVRVPVLRPVIQKDILRPDQKSPLLVPHGLRLSDQHIGELIDTDIMRDLIRSGERHQHKGI